MVTDCPQTRRLLALQHALGANGPATKSAEFAAELGHKGRNRWHNWASKGHRPQRGVDELAEGLANVAAVKARGLDARALAAYALDGVGDLDALLRGPARLPAQPTTVIARLGQALKESALTLMDSSLDPQARIDAALIYLRAAERNYNDLSGGSGSTSRAHLLNQTHFGPIAKQPRATTKVASLHGRNVTRGNVA